MGSSSSSGLLIVLMILSANAFAPPREIFSHRRRRLGANVRSGTVEGPPIATKPDYSSIHGPLGPLMDSLLMSLFRAKLSERLNNPGNSILIEDSRLAADDFEGIVELTSKMNSRYNNRTEIHEIAREVLVSLFPPFILDRYPSWFARPFPVFSARMCAWATVVGGTWLMGECEVNDVPGMSIDGGRDQGVLVKRCRFLEESQCASICVNSCKIPTQMFFRQNMGLPLTMTPDYTTGECQFSFGKTPTEEEEEEAKSTPCLMRCPSGGSMKRWHHDEGIGDELWLADLATLIAEKGVASRTTCLLMDD
ncbi:hypothetical protein ACHAXA_010183 [Cyclostephanos tholiformis]|uniref:Beta-carotene isomerase D27-like C-terminal domain-containing protein n=1 Tax=Cyclostephanos tholiformis TaxID=382380 RepID=A0ABD3R2V2_9STRA